MELLNLQAFHRPDDESDAATILNQHVGSAMVIAGATFVHGLVARGLVTSTEHLIDVSSLPLSFVREEPASVHIGATTTFAQLEEKTALLKQPLFAAIGDALSYPPAQVRNAATVGGCLAASCPFFDLPVVMLALDAWVHVRSVSGVRRMPLSDLYVSLFQTSLAGNEFLTAAEIPVGIAAAASAYEKLETNANDLSLISAAVRVGRAHGVAQGVRIYIGGGVGEIPVRASGAESALEGSPISEANIAAAGEAAANEIDPISDHRASAKYRKAMAAVLVGRSLRRALARLSS